MIKPEKWTVAISGALFKDKIILSSPPILWIEIIMFRPKHLRFSCPDQQLKWEQLMTITLQVSQHRHILIWTYLDGAHACPPSKYVMITAVTQWSGEGDGCHLCNLFVFASAQYHINRFRQTRMNRCGFPCGTEWSWLEVLEWRWGQMGSGNSLRI